MSKKKKKKSAMKIFTRIFMILSIIGMVIWGVLYAANYAIDQYANTDYVDTNGVTITKKEVITALVCGQNELLTDTMIYVRYNVKTGKLAYMSIPRDTYVTNTYCIGHKLNAIYRGKNIEPLVKQVESMLDVNIDYYLVVDNSVVREFVDVLGGVEVNVPIRMKYDDPTQNLHIDLKPGVQVLNGSQAEQFIRFRKGNDGSGYKMGDIERIAVQQEFIKTLIKTIVQPTNILKINDLIKVALGNTDTNVTIREALRYITDVPNIKLDEIYSCTAQGTTPYIDGLSYFKMNEQDTKAILTEHFTDKEQTAETNE